MDKPLAMEGNNTTTPTTIASTVAASVASAVYNSTYEPPQLDYSDWNTSSTVHHYQGIWPDEETYQAAIVARFGPVRDSLYVVIPVTVVWSLIFVAGIIGNISTCVVIARNKSMHTATNYYLFSLAISDLLLLITGMPFEMYMVWRKYPFVFSEVFCVIRGLAAETFTNASVLTITAFTAERYVAICHPFLSQTMSKLSRAVKLILFIWLVAFFFAVPQAMQFGLMPMVKDAKPEDVQCLLKHPLLAHSFELSSLVFFVVPMTVILLLYTLIGLKLKKSTMIKRNCRQPATRKRTESTRVKVGGASKIDRHCRHNRSTRRVLKMLVAVVIAFLLCWAPFHLQRLLYMFIDVEKNRNKPFDTFLVVLTYTSGVLYYFSTMINPILYNIMSNKFREAFVETLAKSCRMSRLVSPRMRRSYSSLSRSQQRNPGNYISKATGVSATGIAQESTDCSGNSYRDDFPVDRALDYSTSESPPRSRQSSKRGIITVDFGSRNSNGSSLSVQEPIKYSRPIEYNFSKLSRDHPRSAHQYDDNADLASSEFEVYTKINLSSVIRPPQQQQQQQRQNGYVNNQIKTDNKKKWWRLLNWLPGLKSLRNSQQALTRPSQPGNIIVELDQPLNKQQQRDDYILQMQTFKIKEEESCRPT